MKRCITTLIACLYIVGCAGEAFVEFGVMDDVLFDAPLGDIGMRVLRIDIPEGGSYTTVWEIGKYVAAPIQSGEFISITDGPLSITPGTYDHVRITVDSVRYENDSTVLLIDSTYVFDANAFTNIIIEENDDLILAINIVSTSWFDANNVQLIPGAEPFDQAALRIHYE